VWALDKKDPFMPPEGGESVADVASRLAAALFAIETEFEGYYIAVLF
jgi:broad specificity phosphatase PhoE